MSHLHFFQKRPPNALNVSQVVRACGALSQLCERRKDAARGDFDRHKTAKSCRRRRERRRNIGRRAAENGREVAEQNGGHTATKVSAREDDEGRGGV